MRILATRLKGHKQTKGHIYSHGSHDGGHDDDDGNNNNNLFIVLFKHFFFIMMVVMMMMMVIIITICFLFCLSIFFKFIIASIVF